MTTRNKRRLTRVHARVSRKRYRGNMPWRVDITGHLFSMNELPPAMGTPCGDEHVRQVQRTITFRRWANFDSELNEPFHSSPRHGAPLCPSSNAGITMFLPCWMSFLSINICMPDHGFLTSKTGYSSGPKMSASWTALLHALSKIYCCFMSGGGGVSNADEVQRVRMSPKV